MTTTRPRRRRQPPGYRSQRHSYENPERPNSTSYKRRTQSTPQKTTTKSSYDPVINGLPGKVFALILGLWSLAINVNNVYNHFAPEASARFIATGILNFIGSLPAFSLLAFLFRVGMGIMAFLLFRTMREKKLMTNAIWLIMWSSCLYGAVVGLGQVILTFPLLLAAYAVAALQYMEIIFWNAKRPGAHLWALVITAYGHPGQTHTPRSRILNKSRFIRSWP